MIAVTFGPPGKRTTLWEYPFTPLSQSFFGNPDSGELCYSIVSSLSSKSINSESKHNMALCPLTIMNKSNQILNFERMILRGPFLTIYFGADNIFTSPVIISFKGADQTSQVVIKKKPQDIDFPGLQSNLKMRTCSGVVLTTYHKHLRALWRQDTLQISQHFLDSKTCHLYHL